MREGARVGAAELIEGAVDGVAEGGDEVCGSDVARNRFPRKRFPLRVRQWFPARVREEAIDDAGEVAEVEADGSDVGGAVPQALRGEIVEGCDDLLAGLEQRVGDGLEQRRDPVYGAAEPDFGLVAHRPLLAGVTGAV